MGWVIGGIVVVALALIAVWGVLNDIDRDRD